MLQVWFFKRTGSGLYQNHNAHARITRIFSLCNNMSDYTEKYIISYVFAKQGQNKNFFFRGGIIGYS
jgi:hypothetical protein